MVVIGGSNIDISGSPHASYISRDSNPGTIRLSPGGVGRNIAENISRIGVSTKLLSVLGNDLHGQLIMQESRSAGIDMNHVMVLENEATSAYLSILDEKKDMISAVSEMDIVKKIDPDYIKKNHGIINGSLLVLIDTNLSEEVIDHIVSTYTDKDIFIDTVSSTKAEKVIHFLGKFHTIKTNRIEAERLSGIKIRTRDDMKTASEMIVKKGVKRVFLTLGEEGIFYTDKEQSLFYKCKPVKAINTSGAGDAFMAALVYAHMADYSVGKTLDFTSAVSELAIQHPQTINPEMSMGNIMKIIEERR